MVASAQDLAWAQELASVEEVARSEEVANIVDIRSNSTVVARMEHTGRTVGSYTIAALDAWASLYPIQGGRP